MYGYIRLCTVRAPDPPPAPPLPPGPGLGPRKAAKSLVFPHFSKPKCRPTPKAYQNQFQKFKIAPPRCILIVS